jgi:hypothetical protein
MHSRDRRRRSPLDQTERCAAALLRPSTLTVGVVPLDAPKRAVFTLRDGSFFRNIALSRTAQPNEPPTDGPSARRRPGGPPFCELQAETARSAHNQRDLARKLKGSLAVAPGNLGIKGCSDYATHPFPGSIILSARRRTRAHWFRPLRTWSSWRTEN